VSASDHAKSQEELVSDDLTLFSYEAFSDERDTPVGGRPLMSEEALYRGTSLIRNRLLLGPYSRTMPRVIQWTYGGGAVSYQRGTPEVASRNFI